MWKLDTSGRIARWRDFRKTLVNLSLDDAVLEVQEFWQGCPFNPYYLDITAPENWPSPWELIAENYYCDLAKALGMLYTICYTTHGNQLEPEIRVYYDSKSQHTYNLAVLCQGKYVLNFFDDTIVNIESINKNLTLKHCIGSKELQL